MSDEPRWFLPRTEASLPILSKARRARRITTCSGIFEPPRTPVRRANVEAAPRCGVDPAIERATARDDERMLAILVDDGHLDVPVGRRGGDLLPHGRAH